MSKQLDLLYTTFLNLEQDYQKSGMSRKDFIIDVFCGDIPTASVIFLDFLRKEVEQPEKVIFIKNCIRVIQENEDRLDSLLSFNFDSDEYSMDFEVAKVFLFDTCNFHRKVQQGEIKHIRVTPESFEYVPIAWCSSNLFPFNDATRMAFGARCDSYES